MAEDTASTTTGGEDGSITLHLQVNADQGALRVPLKIQPTITTTVLRQQVSTATKIPIASLKLIFRGRLIADDNVKIAVDEFKLEDGSVVHCMGKPVSSDQASAAAAAAPSIAPSAAAAAAPTVPASFNLLPSQPQAQPGAAAAGVGSMNNLQTALQTLRSYNPPKVYQTAVQTLDKILTNITTHPLEEKYRKVKKQNAAFQKRLGGLHGGDDAMKAAGFVVELDAGEQVYMIRPSPEAWPRLMATMAMMEAAVRDAQTSLQPVAAPVGAPGLGGGVGMGMPGFPAGVMPNAMQQQAAANLMANPAALQNMMQDPMVQNMMRNDPRLANNPMMQQAMQEMANNPQMAQQVAAMMQNPQMQQRMAQMMQAHGGDGMMPGAGGNMFGAAPQQQQQGGAAPPADAGRSDEDLTEEEMISEAIRRSLQEDGSG